MYSYPWTRVLIAAGIISLAGVSMALESNSTISLTVPVVPLSGLVNTEAQSASQTAEKSSALNSATQSASAQTSQSLSGQKALSTKETAKGWNAPLKNIPLGPGKLDIGYDLRVRYEYSDNFDVRRHGTGKDDHLMLFRNRINFDYKFSDNAHTFVEFQDARYSFSDLNDTLWPVSNPFKDEFDLRQAYAEWKKIGETPFGFKVGRQNMEYGDKHVFGPGEWGNVGRYWWDAAKLYLATEPVQVDFLYGQRIISEPSSFNNNHYPYQMMGAYAQIKKQTWGKFTLKPDLFYIVQYDDNGNIVGESGAGDQQTHSLGFYFESQYGKNWDFGGTFAGQLGKYGRDDINAFGANAKVGYTFDMAWSPRVGAEFSYASGDGNPADGTHSTFDGIFGAVDLYYYGSMNILPWMNLEDYQATFSVKPVKNLTLRLDHHFFRLADARDAWYWASGKPARKDATGAAGSELGQELNIVAQWQATKHLNLFTGYGHFFTGNFIQNTPGNKDDADWFFFQTAFKF